LASLSAEGGRNDVEAVSTIAAPPRIGIVLSGWAPAMTLMSGVMRALIEDNIPIRVISTSGIGGLIGLLSLAPRGKAPDQALRELPNLFVSDLLYRFVPLNFKVFYKNGPFAQASYEFREHLPKIPVDPAAAKPLVRFFNDSMDLLATALTPTGLESYRSGLMSQVSMLEDLVDFAQLRNHNTRFYLSAFDLTAKTQRIFRNQDVGADAYRAAQAMFLLFPPEHVDGHLFTTGATHDPTGLQAIWLHERNKLDMIIALDPMGPAIWRAPKNIHDAFQLMLLNPIVALQVLTFALYANIEFASNQLAGSASQTSAVPTLPKLYRIPFDAPPCDIPPAYYHEMLEWTHDNAVTLESIGYCAAKTFVRDQRLVNPNDFEMQYRYFHRLERRSRQFVRMFDQLRLFAPAFWREHFVRHPEGHWRPRGGTSHASEEA
jgi:NTE family protein